MRLVHLSDLHLGDRPFHPSTRGGDRRERDLAETFQQALRKVVEIAPDLVILSGDLFHHPDPPSTAFLTLTRGVRELQERQPGLAVVAIAGERDTPLRATDPGPVAVLDVIPGVEAASVAPRAVYLPQIGAHVMLVPHRALLAPPYPDLRPDPAARWNVLVLRGSPATSGWSAEAQDGIGVDPTGWDYIAIGGPHVAASWGRNLHAAGALERMGPNPWQEVTAEKGILVMDLERGDRWMESVPLRPVVELAPVRVESGDLASGTRRLRDLLQEVPGGVAGKLVRVRLRGDILAPTEGVDPALLQAIRTQASHVEILLEPLTGDAVAQGARGGGPRSWPTLCWGEDATAHSTIQQEQRLPLSPGLWCVTSHEDEGLDRVQAAIGSLHGASDRSVNPSGPPWGFWLEGEKAPPGGSPIPDRSGVPLPSGSGAEPEDDEAKRWADWIEASGEAEACAMDWARNRQEAESRLLIYRDRARELRSRIQLLRDQGASARCPTCRRRLEDAHPDLMALLEEEWEEVVQDGTWWKRRRQQLEEKPDALRRLEQRAIELQPTRTDGPSHEVPKAALRDPHLEPPKREHLRRAGFLLQRATQGRLLGVVPGPSGRHDEDALCVVDAMGRVRTARGGDHALLRLALEWAEGEDVPERSVHLVLSAAAPDAPAEGVIRLLESGHERAPALCRLVVVSPAVARRLTAVTRGILEIGLDEGGQPTVRVHPGGQVRLVLGKGDPAPQAESLD